MQVFSYDLAVLQRLHSQVRNIQHNPKAWLGAMNALKTINLLSVKHFILFVSTARKNAF